MLCGTASQRCLHCKLAYTGDALPAVQSMRAYAEWGRETEMKVQDSSGLARPDEQLSFLQLQVCPVFSSKPWRSSHEKVHRVWPGAQQCAAVDFCNAMFPCISTTLH